MGKIVIMSIVAVVALFVTMGFGQETAKPAESAKAVEKAVKRQAPRGAFTGTVVDVNVPSQSLSVKERGTVVTFDASNPTFSGYRGLAEVRRGDRVAVSYTPNGIRIARFAGKAPAETEAAAATQRKQSKETGKLQRRDRREHGGTFEDVDVNQDGKITAVELSVLVTNITMEQFRTYDKNGDGALDKREFLEMVRRQRSGK